MSYTQTPNYALYKPTVNSDNDQWGTHLNANADTIDTQLKTIANTAGVVSFNTRTGAVSLLNADVTTVLPPSSTTPVMSGAGAVGTGTTWSRADHQHPSDTSRATTGYVDAAVAGALHDVGRNLLHNPLFNVAQRGQGPWAAGGYTLDRWQLALTLDTVSISQVALSDGARVGISDEAARFCLQNGFTGNAGAGAFNEITHSIESVARLSGKTVTLSFWATGSVALKLGINGYQNFGTGGSPSAAVSILATGASVQLTTSWARYSVTLAIPSMTGKTLGTNGNDCTTLQVFFSSGATNGPSAGNIGVQSGTVQLWGVQLEIGSVATPLEKPDPRYDLANCCRFFQTLPFFLGGYGSGNGAGAYFPFPMQMRAAPTIAPSFTTQTNCSGSSASAPNAQAYSIYTNVGAAGGFSLIGTFTASADL